MFIKSFSLFKENLILKNFADQFFSSEHIHLLTKKYQLEQKLQIQLSYMIIDLLRTIDFHNYKVYRDF